MCERESVPFYRVWKTSQMNSKCDEECSDNCCGAVLQVGSFSRVLAINVRFLVIEMRLSGK